MNNPSTSFCILPFYGKELMQNGKSITCCIMDQSDVPLEEIQKEMLTGTKPSVCNQCWKLEAAGKQSDRMIKNNTFDVLVDRDIRYVYQDCVEGKNKTNFYKIYLGNICNAACTTCTSFFSTKWGNITGNTKSYYLSKEQLDADIDYANAVFISFLGGEPLLHKNFYHVLSQLEAHGNTKCTIDIVTNVSTIPDQTMLTTLKKFPNLSFTLSIDGLDSVFDYLRWPLQWVEVNRNVEFYKANFTVYANITLSNLNIHHLGKLEAWMKDQNILYHVNPVMFPDHMSPSILPVEYKEKIQHGLDFIDFKSYDTQFDAFCNAIKLQDQRKSIDIRNYIPELGRYIYAE